jgi:hypothetical protein
MEYSTSTRARTQWVDETKDKVKEPRVCHRLETAREIDSITPAPVPFWANSDLGQVEAAAYAEEQSIG